MSAHQSYLEAPYVASAAAEAAFERWAERELPDLDWDDSKAVDGAWADFEDAMDDRD